MNREETLTDNIKDEGARNTGRDPTEVREKAALAADIAASIAGTDESHVRW